jgi:hypothetical protein
VTPGDEIKAERAERCKHTDEQIEQAAARFEQWAETLTSDDFEDAADLREIAQATDALQANKTRLYSAVHAARYKGRSWGQIGIALGVSRQAARERFGDKVNEGVGRRA